MNWDKVNSIAVLVGNTNRYLLDEFLKKSNKSVDVFVYHDDVSSISKECFLSVNNKDFNFFDLPKSEASQKIKEKLFDVLINLDFNNISKLKALTGLIPAKCKLGPKEATYNEFFEISLQSDKDDFLNNALKYLMMIKS